jgi:hypothetical protein
LPLALFLGTDAVNKLGADVPADGVVDEPAQSIRGHSVKLGAVAYEVLGVPVAFVLGGPRWQVRRKRFVELASVVMAHYSQELFGFAGSLDGVCSQSHVLPVVGDGLAQLSDAASDAQVAGNSAPVLVHELRDFHRLGVGSPKLASIPVLMTLRTFASFSAWL